MKLSISGRATRQVLEIYLYVARDDRLAADRVRAKIYEICDFVARYPRAGHMTRIDGLRAFPANPDPYVVYFRFFERQRTVRIVRVLHSARRRPALRDEPSEFRAAAIS